MRGEGAGREGGRISMTAIIFCYFRVAIKSGFTEICGVDGEERREQLQLAIVSDCTGEDDRIYFLI